MREVLVQFEFVEAALQDKVAVIAIHRPQALNALSAQVCAEITQAVERIDSGNCAHVIILSGDDKNFAAGADIGSMATADPLAAESYVQGFSRCINAVYRCSIPVLAYIQGFALGGGLELALAADIRLAAHNAKFGFPEINLGIIPGAGGTQRLPRLVGTAKAKEIIMSGKNLDAAAALTLGLVNHIYPEEQLWEKTLALAQQLAEKPLQALKKAKLAINAADSLDIGPGMLYEAANFVQLFSTEDQKEGMAAFLEKRKPRFIGR